jgi:hypothetical protein
VILPHVGDVLDEEHNQDVVFVFGGVYGAAKGVAGFPQDAVDFFLGDTVVFAVVKHFELGGVSRHAGLYL